MKPGKYRLLVDHPYNIPELRKGQVVTVLREEFGCAMIDGPGHEWGINWKYLEEAPDG